MIVVCTTAFTQRGRYMSTQEPIVKVVDTLLLESETFNNLQDAAVAVQYAITANGISKLLLKMSVRELVAGRRQFISGLLWVALETDVAVEMAEEPIRELALVS